MLHYNAKALIGLCYIAHYSKPCLLSKEIEERIQRILFPVLADIRKRKPVVSWMVLQIYYPDIIRPNHFIDTIPSGRVKDLLLQIRAFVIKGKGKSLLKPGKSENMRRKQ